MAGSLMQSAITSAFEQMRSFRLAGTSGTPRSNCRTHSMAHAHNTRRNISGLGDAAAHTYLLRDIAVCMQGWLGAGLGLWVIWRCVMRRSDLSAHMLPVSTLQTGLIRTDDT